MLLHSTVAKKSLILIFPYGHSHMTAHNTLTLLDARPIYSEATDVHQSVSYGYLQYDLLQCNQWILCSLHLISSVFTASAPPLLCSFKFTPSNIVAVKMSVCVFSMSFCSPPLLRYQFKLWPLSCHHPSWHYYTKHSNTRQHIDSK